MKKVIFIITTWLFVGQIFGQDENKWHLSLGQLEAEGAEKIAELTAQIFHSAEASDFFGLEMRQVETVGGGVMATAAHQSGEVKWLALEHTKLTDSGRSFTLFLDLDANGTIDRVIYSRSRQFTLNFDYAVDTVMVLWPLADIVSSRDKIKGKIVVYDLNSEKRTFDYFNSEDGEFKRDSGGEVDETIREFQFTFNDLLSGFFRETRD